ncbi:tRNA pseudouridine(55) synthase TruB [Candidatus Peregrinibacteria bacterium]|nr:tRNA pseudouridine(55) synthase TruB [Candidatus Peregrinibacteria bacterium]
MDGFLTIYKPSGMTSFDVIRFVRSIKKVKMGHIGTLDPLAEGVLVIALGQGTKLIEYMMDHTKRYVAEITLGKESTTYDAEGELRHISDIKPSKEEVVAVIDEFTGALTQVPPVFSALKINGKPAYKRARAGESITMKKRNVTIHEHTLESYHYPTIRVSVTCSTGTYIRSLAHDIGEHLGTGGYLSYLQRTAIDTFTMEHSCSLEQLKERGIEPFLLPLIRGIGDMPRKTITAQEYKKLQHGAFVQGTLPKNVAICAAIFNNDLVGIMEPAPVKNHIKFKKHIHVA